MFNDLTARGIDETRVLMEDKSTSTQENLAFSLDLLERRLGTRPGKIGVLSNEFHLYRAGRVAAEQGVEAVGIPAETSWKLLLVNYFLREIAGVWYYAVSESQCGTAALPAGTCV